MDEITVINSKGRTMQISKRAWDLLGNDKGDWQEFDAIIGDAAVPLEIIEFQAKFQETEITKVDTKTATPPVRKTGRPANKTTKR